MSRTQRKPSRTAPVSQAVKDADQAAIDKTMAEIAKHIEGSKEEEAKAEEAAPLVNELQAFAQREMQKIAPRKETHRLQIDCKPLSETVVALVEDQLNNRDLPENLPYKYDGHICGGQSVLILRCFDLAATKKLLAGVNILNGYAQEVIISDFTLIKAETTKQAFSLFIGE